MWAAQSSRRSLATAGDARNLNAQMQKVCSSPQRCDSPPWPSLPPNRNFSNVLCSTHAVSLSSAPDIDAMNLQKD
jgi:hypothetical protein